MELITPLSPEKNYSDKKMVFLAGPIKGAPDWQKKAVQDLSDLDIYLANPRRKNSANFDFDTQINWESNFLAASDIIMFWIPKKTTEIEGRDYAQTTRFELAEWAAKTRFNSTHKKIVVGIDNAFFGKSYIVKRLAEQNIPVFNTYEETLQNVRQLICQSTRIFFTSDTHFGSQRALSYSRRPFVSVQEMDEVMIKNWNNKVAFDDVVYHLGDFGNLEIRSYLAGKIHLILGNYETDRLKENSKFQYELAKHFESILPHTALTLKNDDTVYLTHKPSECIRGTFNLFGHIHGLKKVSYNGLNVGVDANHFTPLSEDDVLFFKNAILHNYDYEVFL